MRVKTTYIANDGTEFKNEKDCMEYEEQEKIMAKNAVKFAEQIKKYCQNHDCDGYCIFYKDCDCFFGERMPEYWRLDDLNI